MKKVCVLGASGFIGHHLCKYLKRKNFWVRGVDIIYPDFLCLDQIDNFLKLDLKNLLNCLEATSGIDEVYQLSANMGGIGFITSVKAEVMRDNVLINANVAEATRINKVRKVFFSSSACVYNEEKQKETDILPLKESDAYPALPDTPYGWEKLFSERVYQAYKEDYGLDIRIARFHNIYGPETTYQGGREKAPAAICRKVAQAQDGEVIEIWGDGKQTRSFCYIDDCLEGINKLIESNWQEPINIGSDRLVTIDEMVNIVCKIANKKLKKVYLKNQPQGVRGRNADLTLCKKVLNWKPNISLENGLKDTYEWINEQIHA